MLGRLLGVLVVAGLVAVPAHAAPTVTEPVTLSKPGVAIASGPGGALWIAERENPGRIARVVPGGAVTEYTGAVTAGFTKDRKPADIAVGPDGALWFVEGVGTGFLGRITTGGVVSEFGPLAGEPTGVAAGPDGKLWVALKDADLPGQSSVGAVAKLSTSGATLAEYATGAENPTHIASGPDGALWFSEPGAVGRVTTAGAVTKLASALTPLGLTGAADGAVYFAAGTAIGRATVDGGAAALPTPLLDQATAIAEGPDGALWFTVKDAIGRMRPDGAVTIHPMATTGYPATDITAGPDGAMWFTRQDERLGRITVPPHVGDAHADLVEQTTAEVHATVRANAATTTATLQLRAPGQQLVATQQVQVPPGTAGIEVAFALNGLSPATVYTASVTASSAAGGALEPAVTAFQTKAAPVATPTPTATATATATPPSATPTPSATPGPEATASSTPVPVASPEPAPAAAPVPVLGDVVVLETGRGEVRVRTKGQAAFVPLSAITAIPVGAVVDAARGEVRLESELPGGTTQVGLFSGGRFRVGQSPTGTTRLSLVGPLHCSQARSLKASRKRKRRLWGRDDGGSFSTQGRDSVATVRGTRWLTMDTCRGTLTRVTEGAVSVRAKRSGKTVLVAAGERHFVPHR